MFCGVWGGIGAHIFTCACAQGWTKFDFAGRNNKYSDFKWNFNHFTGVDYNADGGKTCIYKIQGDGKDWARNVDTENGN